MASTDDGDGNARRAGRSITTLRQARMLALALPEAEIRAVVAQCPTVCQELYWGKRLACVVVGLAGASPEHLQELLIEAWLRRARKTLARNFLTQGQWPTSWSEN